MLSHAAFRARTFATLKKYILGSQVQLDDLSNDLGSVALEGPRAASIDAEATGLALTGFSEFAVADVQIDAVPCHLIRRSHFGGVGAEIVAPRQHLLYALDASCHQHSLAARFAHRHESAERAAPRSGHSRGFRSISTTRLFRTKPRWKARTSASTRAATPDRKSSSACARAARSIASASALKFSTAEPPAPGTKLRAGGNDVGYVTSSAFSPGTGTAIGMGYLRREHNAVGSIVEFDGGTAEVTGGKTTAASD